MAFGCNDGFSLVIWATYPRRSKKTMQWLLIYISLLLTHYVRSFNIETDYFVVHKGPLNSKFGFSLALQKDTQQTWWEYFPSYSLLLTGIDIHVNSVSHGSCHKTGISYLYVYAWQCLYMIIVFLKFLQLKFDVADMYKIT